MRGYFRNEVETNSFQNNLMDVIKLVGNTDGFVTNEEEINANFQIEERVDEVPMELMGEKDRHDG